MIGMMIFDDPSVSGIFGVGWTKGYPLRFWKGGVCLIFLFWLVEIVAGKALTILLIGAEGLY